MLRSGAHDLEVSLARRRAAVDRLPREERFCRVCDSGEVEDLGHFLLDCAPLRGVREVVLAAVSTMATKDPRLLPLRSLSRVELIGLLLGKLPQAVDTAPKELTARLDRLLMRGVSSLFRYRLSRLSSV
jgi:hypothetical protein